MTVPQVVRVTPPLHLLDPTPVPDCQPQTNGDLLECIWAIREALERANADKAAARAACIEGDK